MSKWLIEVDVNEETLLEYKADGISEEDIPNLSIEGMITEELAWVWESGIIVTSIKQLADD